MAEAGLVPLDRSVSIPTGIDAEGFASGRPLRDAVRRSLGLAAETPVVGVVAFLRPDKGHRVLLEAMPSVLKRYPGTILLAAGDGSERSGLEAHARTLRLGNSVRFLGRRDDVPGLLTALDVFCLPSVRNEGVPQAILQASAAGLPIVSTRVGGIPEAVRHGDTGLLVEPGDPSALADAVCGLLSDASLRARMGIAGAEHVRARFSLAGMLDRTEDAFAAALGIANSDRPHRPTAGPPVGR
jgi:glycosyltransferase involved in cell wall biosynthesis